MGGAPNDGLDEFGEIERLFRPLAVSPEALSLMDDAAVLPQRSGFELVVTADAMVEGVHFLADDPSDLVAKKLLRVNLSDLAAKAAEPYGYMLTVAWSPAWDAARRGAFARGLGEDQATYGLALFGGDTVSTPGPMTASVTLFGWVEQGRMVKRSGARAGDLVLVSGTIGDGVLGLKAARGEIDAPDAGWLAERYRLPKPRTALRAALLAYASSAADVSDGLLADAAHLGEASGLSMKIALNQMPISAAAQSVLSSALDSTRRSRSPSEPGLAAFESDEGVGAAAQFVELATGGDDYEIVCTCAPASAEALVTAARQAGVLLTPIGRMVEGRGVAVTWRGQAIVVETLGWRHG